VVLPEPPLPLIAIVIAISFYPSLSELKMTKVS